MLLISETKEGILFNIRVIPRSSRCEVAGIYGEALKVKITAPPVEGKANEECIRFLSRFLGVKRKQLTIVSGAASKNKRVSVAGITKKDIESIIATL